MTGTLFIIAAASGTGKTTLVRSLCRDIPNLHVSISCTTRPMRPGEKDGIDYYFIDNAAFDAMVAKGQFLEYKNVFDYRYGTPRHWVEEQLQKGNDIILEIDWQGAQEMRTMLPEQIVSIFILPPAFATLEQRLRGRKQDSEATIHRRMRDAVEELSHYPEFDYLVVNDNLETALSELKAIIEARRRGERYIISDRRAFAGQLMAEARKIQ